MNPSIDLSGKKALVTGAGRGIGRAIALALAEAGADVVVCARSSEDIAAVAEAIRKGGREALAMPCDVTDPERVRQMAEKVNDEFGPIDILVNNAGRGGSHKFLTHPDELWHEMLAVNLTSVYYVTKAFVAGMVERRRGRIINIASVASKVGGRYIAAYTAAKHGVLGLTRALALELAGYHITVNAICPGFVDTPMTDASVANIASRTGMSEEEARQTLEKMSPQNRLIKPEEVAAVAVLLASDIAQGINGQAINVDGGMVMF